PHSGQAPDKHRLFGRQLSRRSASCLARRSVLPYLWKNRARCFRAVIALSTVGSFCHSKSSRLRLSASIAAITQGFTSAYGLGLFGFDIRVCFASLFLQTHF